MKSDYRCYGNVFNILTHKDTPDDIIYNILVAIYEDDAAAHFKKIQPLYKRVDMIGVFAGKEFPIPYHPGAKKFWWELWQKRGLL
jgi:TRAP-type uncharacterized transport system substrate-binding protein